MAVHLEFGVPGTRDARVRTTWMSGTEPVVGWAWVQHGFARRGRHLEGLAGALAAAGISSVRPDIASLVPRHSIHDPAFLTASALTIARRSRAHPLIPARRRRRPGGPIRALGVRAGWVGGPGRGPGGGGRRAGPGAARKRRVIHMRKSVTDVTQVASCHM